MKIKLLIFSLFFIHAIGVFADVTIRGTAPEYAGYELKFYTFADPISNEKTPLATISVSSDGTFAKTFKLERTVQAFSDFDAYATHLYLVPGNEYEIVLPPQKKVTESQKRNPFFKPENIYLATKNAEPTELNRRIRAFDQAFMQAESEYFNAIYHQKSGAAADSVKHILKENFPKTDNSFFEDYKFYRLAFLEFALHQGRNENFIANYFVEHVPNYQVAPCKNLFNRLFTDYFAQQLGSIEASDFRKVMASNNPNQIADYFIQQNHFNRELAQMVILKSINDAFFQGEFSQKSLLSLLNKIQQGNWDSQKKEIATRLKSQLTYLLPGTEAPQLTMTDLEGNRRTLADHKNELVYLHFTRVENPICRQHLEALRKLPEGVFQKVKILNLILPDEASKKDAIEKQNWPGEFQIITEDAAENWKVKSFPTAYLVDENGKLIYSPAATPQEGFARQIGSLLQKRHLQELRNQAK